MSSLTVSLIQADLKWENKEANLIMLEEKISKLGKTELVVLPEMFSTGFSMKPEELAETMDGPSVDWMKRVAEERKIILTGSLIIEEDGDYYNRLIWMLPNGQLGYYNKRHLFAFANEDQHYTAGDKRLIASVKGWKINLQVCYDLRFPVWARQKNSPYIAHQEDEREFGPPEFVGQAPEEPEYDMLIYVANWPEKRSHAWKTLLQARAIENQCYVIGVNRVGNDGNNIYHSGDSMIVDPLGSIIYTESGKEFVYTTTLEKKKLEEIRAKMPFLKDGDSFLIV